MSIHDQSNISLLINILEQEFTRKAVINPNFVDFFNDQLERYHEKRFNYKNLQDMNKQLLSSCFQFISNENRKIEKNTMVLKPPPNHGFQSPSDNIKQKQNNNDEAFDSYKKQYDTMLNPNKPKEIDFSDTIEDQPIQNIDSIVNQTLEDREKELMKITNTYSDKPPDWIKPPENKQTSKNEPMKLIIEDTPLSNQPSSILKQKKVKFDLNNKSRNSPKESVTVNKLLNKLKLKQKSNVEPVVEPNNIDVKELLTKLETKLETKMETKINILTEKYDKLRIKYEELEMKYSELIKPETSNLSKNEIEMLYT